MKNREMSPIMQINPVSLCYVGEWKHLEAEFLRDYNTKSIKYARIAFSLGLFFYAIFGLLDIAIVPEQKEVLWFIRYAVVCPLIICCTLLTFWSGFPKWSQHITVFIIVVTGGGISFMVALIPPPATFSYYAGVILVLMLGYGFVKIRFLWASLGGWINVIVYEFVAIGIVETPVSILINNNFFFISANIIGMFTSYGFEYYARKDFFMARMLAAERQKIVELNRGLEKTIHERTAELQQAYDSLKKETQDREALQSQLLHAQKMESVGRLAGGVAHDFNNILGVIIGFSELALRKITPDDPLYRDLQEISKAAGRSHDITRQLLAFARKETIAPIVIDVNAGIESMLKVLRRLIGEDIKLTWLRCDFSLPILIDRSQLEQLLANLCVNARDAISDVGEIIIGTDTRRIEKGFAGHGELPPGEYVSLTVSDNGKGMDKETLENIFEPFYTTKGVGQGTGLGLATAHGIVEQNNGFIHVASEPGIGTTFKILLPLIDGRVIQEELQPSSETVAGSGERVLVVEDEPSILKLVERLLSDQGYRVYTARTPIEALKIASMHHAEIDLLITDVIMPEMNGRELAKQIVAMNPAIKCLYMSGYSENIIAHRGVLKSEIHLIKKPFTSSSLSRKIRTVLEAA